MSVFVFSDLHGNYSLWEQIRDFMQPIDRAYCLGDCADRGPDGLRIMEEVYNDPRITYIRGNHEDMMLKAIRRPNHFSDAMRLWMWNGGEPTYTAWCEEKENTKWIKRIMDMPIYEQYVNTSGNIMWLSHAGFGGGNHPEDIDTQDLIWDRDHIYEVKWYGAENEFIIHGHTPTQHLISEIDKVRRFYEDDTKSTKWTPQAIYYCEDHKIDIDLGTYISNSAILMDLDTGDEHLFIAKIKE